MCTPDIYRQISKPAQKPDPNMIPLGDGLADRARLVIQQRRRRVDEAVDAAQR